MSEWNKAEAEAIAGLLQDTLKPQMEALYVLLGESPEAWRGAALFASGIFNITERGAVVQAPPPLITAEIVTLASMLITHPLAEEQLKKIRAARG